MAVARVVKIASRLISVPSENPPGDERGVAKELEKILDEQGIPHKRVVYDKKRVNVIAKVGEGKRRLLLLTHLDTVPAGNDWKSDPFKPVIKKGKLYGRGSSDDKGNLAAAVEAMIRVKGKIDGELVLAATANEECGGKYGLHSLLEEGRLSADAALLVDVGAFKIDIAEKGPLWLKLQAKGKSAHGANPEKGENAIMKMSRALERLSRLELGGNHPLLGKPTINVGTICGGEKTNMVPDLCEATIDVRMLPKQKESEIIRKIRRVAGVKVEKISSVRPCETDPKSEIVKALKTAVKEVTGFAKLEGVAGCTCLSLLPMPAVATGFGSGTAHEKNEFIRTKDLEKGAEVLEKTVLLYLRSKPL